MRLTNKLVNGKGYTYKYNDFDNFEKRARDLYESNTNEH